ncbi:ATP dependent RNA helicase and U5 mRNA splicing factor [Scheffersomyces coipomensis]|uniref:ATP dependent RNA helicase and U5 mRNA splicing factor n=1 Tax=Scheffersomyces coipomensis TaxID=1788519 RepID=UPI00315D1A39
MDSDDLYDEFGNLINEDSGDSDDESLDDFLVDESDEFEENSNIEDHNIEQQSLIKRDTNPLDNVTQIIVKPYEESDNVPVIQRAIEKKVRIDYSQKISSTTKDEDFENLPEIIYSRSFMIDTMKTLPERIRNIAVIGNLHSGKTSLLDSLVLQTHAPSIALKKTLKNFKPLRFLDNHKIEVDRGLSIKSSPITLLLNDLRDKSYVFNFLDCPGHTSFADETSAALNVVDGAILVIDAVEGLSPRDKSLITQMLKLNIPFTLLINKIDRLILELKLPPQDSYYKLKYIIDDINNYIQDNEFILTYEHQTPISPSNNNVIFSSSTYEFSFTLLSFAKIYLDRNPKNTVNIEEFSKKLWGDYYFDSTNNAFTSKSTKGSIRTFVSFILEPIYKIMTYTLVSSDDKLPKLLWTNFGVTLPKDLYKKDIQILLKEVFKAIFYGNRGLTNSLVNSITYHNPSDSKLVGKVVKLIESSDAKFFYALVRVYSGSFKIGSRIKVLGENYEEDDEDYTIDVVDELYLPGGRYRIPVKEVGEGFLALVKGVGSNITKGGSYIYDEDAEVSNIPVSQKFGEKSVFKVAVEPAAPSELPKLLEGLRKLNKAYLDCVINVEESGEHVILAPGELYMDCMLHDLRNFFTDDLEIKVSDPMTKFGETCIETSSTKIPTKTTTGSNQISIIAEPIKDNKLSHAIETNKINLKQPVKTIAKYLRNDIGWDALAARSVWYFGPADLQSPSILLDDTLEDETDKESLESVKDSIRLGFKWGISEGPLCGEPIRDVKFKILDAVISGSEVQRSSTQIIPMTRRACYTGFLTASPRLMEPIYTIDIVCNEKAIRAVEHLLQSRRGYLVNHTPIPASPLFQLEGIVPVIESVGLETDMRLQTQGQAMCFLSFKKWDIVPGDPFDTNVALPALKPVPYKSLARDFVMKTRKRKGLPGEPSLQKYIEPELYTKLKEKGFIN